MNALRNTAVSGLAGIALLAVTGPVAMAAGPVSEANSVVCGTDDATGLAVSAGRAEECSAALQVAGAYTRDWDGTGDAATTVHAAGSTWSCREQEGSPNPYQQCVDTSDSSRWITLTS
ncbi:hypothetical protein ACFQMH_40795 [Streptomyces viridiviolaceus]|uniref:Secreted protein n=1 Tax=Streptomyces viridiviolaceus TaxID=68282 RepID=A0ABW2ECP0_9ACTN|nr:hypothetical protein [Streptomyces viridiviolaceus]